MWDSHDTGNGIVTFKVDVLKWNIIQGMEKYVLHQYDSNDGTNFRLLFLRLASSMIGFLVTAQNSFWKTLAHASDWLADDGSLTVICMCIPLNTDQ